jgi:ectoine hydroxylase-related dioxygenase (phytanoyl-CoA dioxygenase family)
VNLLLSDYGPGSGPIAFLPGSHRFRREPTPAEMRGLVPHMVPVEAPAGSAVIWPADTWHMALPRRDAGLRVTLLLHFCRAHLQTQSDFRGAVGPEVLERNPGRFAQLLNVWGVFPFGREDADEEKRRRSRERFRLADGHPQWRSLWPDGRR